MITEDYVSFEVAKLLKKKGFDEKINTYYLIHLDSFYELFHKKDEFPNPEDIWLKCPTHQIALKWLREIHHIHANPIEQGNYDDHSENYSWIVSKDGVIYRYQSVSEKLSYKDAVEAAIKYCLTNLIK